MYELFLLAEREELVSGLLNASEEMDRPPQDVWNRICLHLVSDSKWSSPFGNWINDNPRLDAEKTSEWIQANLDSLPIDTNQITRFKDME